MCIVYLYTLYEYSDGTQSLGCREPYSVCQEILGRLEHIPFLNDNKNPLLFPAKSTNFLLTTRAAFAPYCWSRNGNGFHGYGLQGAITAVRVDGDVI